MQIYSSPQTACKSLKVTSFQNFSIGFKFFTGTKSKDLLFMESTLTIRLIDKFQYYRAEIEKKGGALAYRKMLSRKTMSA